MSLNINFKATESGIAADLNGKKFSLIYPDGIWKQYPEDQKSNLVDNLAHLLTINVPLIAGVKKIKYNTARPIFKPLFDEVVRKSLPHAIEDYKIRTEKILKQFSETEYEFSGESNKKFIHKKQSQLVEQSVNPLSFGKDSLTSLAVCAEIGLEPIGFYINDTVSPTENKIKLRRTKKFSKKFDIRVFAVTNELEQLNDFEFWEKPETCVGYTHMVTGFCFISLPFVQKFGTKYIALGNQQDMNFGFKNKDGFQTYPSYDQTSEWMLSQNKMIKEVTGGRTGVMSVIEPLTNIALTKILHTRYSEFGKYQVSCDCLNASDESRWCHDCNKCARNVLFMRAFDIDPNRVGLRNILLDKTNKRLFCLFGGEEIDCYEKSKEARGQQLLAFLMAHQNGERGPLLELFKKRFLEEAKERESELRKKFFKIYKSKTMPKRIEQLTSSIYKEELSDFV
jgi:hypothetical protein